MPQPLYPSFPRFQLIVGPGSPLRASWATVNRAPRPQKAVETASWLRRGAETRCSAFIQAHLPRRRLSHLTSATLMWAPVAHSAGRSASGYPRTPAATPRPRPSVGVDGPRRHQACQNEIAVDLRQRRPSVEQISRIGMDTSKHIFQLHGVNTAEEPVLRSCDARRCSHSGRSLRRL